MNKQLRLAILDDYQDLAHRIVDWNQIPGLSVVAFKDHVYTEDELVARLQGFAGFTCRTFW